jgi:hypothetical protein
MASPGRRKRFRRGRGSRLPAGVIQESTSGWIRDQRKHDHVYRIIVLISFHRSHVLVFSINVDPNLVVHRLPGPKPRVCHTFLAVFLSFRPQICW